MNRVILKKTLIDKNVSAAKMAKELDMAPQRISDMMAGRLKGYKYRSRLCRYLDIPEEILFPEDGNKQKSCQ